MLLRVFVLLIISTLSFVSSELSVPAYVVWGDRKFQLQRDKETETDKRVVRQTPTCTQRQTDKQKTKKSRIGESKNRRRKRENGNNIIERDRQIDKLTDRQAGRKPQKNMRIQKPQKAERKFK